MPLPRHHVAAHGFTLIELMIAVAIISVLSAIAYPAYQNHVLRTHRAVAASCLQELALQMERRYTLQMAYDQPATLPVLACATAANARYAFSFDTVPANAGAAANPPNRPTANAYRLQATPQGAQAADTGCGTLGLDQQGVRTRSGNAPDVQSCWR